MIRARIPDMIPDMRSLSTLARLALLGVILAATAADAQAPDLSKAYRERRALVVGIDSYTHWKALGYARSDAEAVGKKLASLGFRVDYLLDRQATKAAIIARLADLKRQVVDRDQVFIYFSGHGQTEEVGKGAARETLGYLVPVDGRADDPFQTAISMTQLRDLAKGLNANHVMFALDACFSGALLAAKGPAGTRERTPAYFREMLETPVRFVLTAGTAEQEAVEVGRSGLFTRQLLAALDGAAARPGSGGLVTGNDIGAFVQRAVIEQAAQHGRKQTPQFGPMMGQGTGEFLLALKVAKLAPEAPRRPERPDVEEVVRQALGALEFSSRIAGVEVWLKGADDRDDQKVGEIRAGRGLVRNNLPVGNYRVRARKDGYRDWERVVQVAGNQTRDVAIDIEPLRAPPPPPPSDDGAEMVRVPTGEFVMGSDDGAADEKPRHRVHLDAYSIDKYEVTNALYRRFMDAASRAAPSYWNDSKWNGVSQPVVGVTWHDADAYCKWAGKRLPTEAEWEKAARGTDGRKYPWGNDWDSRRANSTESQLGKTAPVGSYASGVSPYGAHDMAGNVWEWVADWFDASYYQRSPERNPTGPETGQRRVLRGGSWLSNPINLRTADRLSVSPEHRNTNVGFRCARGAF
jgi:formylglycine-generating enzyme required for sulfatase activity